MANFQEQGLSKPKPGEKRQAPVLGAYQSLDLLDFIGKKGVQLSPEEQAMALEKKRLEDELKKAKALQDEFARMNAAIASVLQELEGEKKAWWQKFQKEVSEVVLLMAGRVVETELKTNPQVVLGGIETLIRELGDGEKRNFLVNPEDLALLESSSPEAARALKETRHVSLIPDATLPRGSVRLDRNNYQMEYSLSKALAALSSEIVPNPALTGTPPEAAPQPEAAAEPAQKAPEGPKEGEP